MKKAAIFKIKAWLTVALGALFLFFSAQVMTIMGGELNSAGTVITQLFGLVLMAAGWGMVVSGDSVPGGSEALAVVLTDSTAMLILVMATSKGVFGGPGYALAAVYAGSAMLYLYFYLSSRRV
jgi:hypothetical protein